MLANMTPVNRVLGMEIISEVRPEPTPYGHLHVFVCPPGSKKSDITPRTHLHWMAFLPGGSLATSS
jgi:hypothetical protein